MINAWPGRDESRIANRECQLGPSERPLQQATAETLAGGPADDVGVGDTARRGKQISSSPSIRLSDLPSSSPRQQWQLPPCLLKGKKIPRPQGKRNEDIGKKKKSKNIQHQGCAGRHRPNY